MKKTVLFLLLALCWSKVNAQCWKSADIFSGIKTDGTLWKWGRGEFGQVGDGTNIDKSSPVKIGTDSNWKEAISTGATSFAIKTDGTLWAWGRNNYGQIGDGTNTNKFVPIQIGTDNNWKSISAILDHCLAIKTDGTLWAWGNNSFGQIGDGTNIDRNVPVQIGTDTDWQIATTGHYHSLAIKTNGTLWTWGYNNSGQLGHGDLVNRNVPYPVGTNSDWMTIKAHGYNSYALKTNGTLWAWGRNVDYELGDGTLVNRPQPVQIGTDTNWDKLGIRCVRKSDGTLWGWGYNLTGDLGDGTSVTKTVPTQIGTDTDWLTPYHKSIKLKTDGTLWTSGNNQGGTLGVGIQVPFYSTTYTLVQILTTNCPPEIIANDDSGSIVSGFSNTPVYNVLSNDTYDGATATFSNVTLSFVSSSNGGITLNTTTGAVTVDPAVLPGNYTLVYQICAANNASNCDTATVSITVNPRIIEATDDNFTEAPINYLTGGVSPGVLYNDRINGSILNSSQVTIALVGNGGITGATISSTGIITVPVGTPIGTYDVKYSICDVTLPTNCDIAIAKILVAMPVTTTPTLVNGIRANSIVYRSGIQTNGKILIMGPFTKYNNINVYNFTRLNSDLTLDTSYLSTGPVLATQEIQDFKLQADNKAIVVGEFNSFSGSTNGKGIVRLDTNGRADQSFNVGGSGVGPLDRILSCAIQADGKILLGGGFISSYNGVPTRNMIRLNTDGTLDTSFQYPYTYEPSTFGSIHTITVLSSGKIVVTGNRSYATDSFGNQIGQPNVFRLNPDGSLDTSFSKAFVESDHLNISLCSTCITPIQNVIVQPDGRIIIVGSFYSYAGTTKNNIVRLKANGTLDAFGSVTTSDRAIKDAVIESTGKIIIGGEFNNYGGSSKKKLARLNADGSIDNTFNPGSSISAIGSNFPFVADLQMQVDKKIIVSGGFAYYNDIAASNITRIVSSVTGGQARNGMEYYETEPEIDIHLADANGIKIYPNPSSGIFTIDLTESKGQFTTIAVYNALGQAVYQKNTLPEAVNEIDLSALPSGYYYAKIAGSSGSVQKVLLKK